MSLNLCIRPEESIILGGALKIKARESNLGIVLSVIALKPFLFCEGETIDIGVEKRGNGTVLVGISTSSHLSISQEFAR